MSKTYQARVNFGIIHRRQLVVFDKLYRYMHTFAAYFQLITSDRYINSIVISVR